MREREPFILTMKIITEEKEGAIDGAPTMTEQGSSTNWIEVTHYFQTQSLTTRLGTMEMVRWDNSKQSVGTSTYLPINIINEKVCRVYLFARLSRQNEAVVGMKRDIKFYIFLST